MPRERGAQLVAWLALKHGWIGRAELAALLWPEHPGGLAATNLRKALHRLRGVPWAAGLEMQGQALRVANATDVHEFEAALAQGQHQRALTLYGGELLHGFDDPANNAWTERLRFERERLHAAWRGAALQWLARPETDAGAAAALAAQLIAADPLDEAALAVQMQVLARSGQIGAARAAFHAYAQRLQQELGIVPGSALRALHDTLATPADAALANAPGRSEARASAERVAPEPDPGFVGRSAELARIGELLAQPDCPLLTLVGPGGVGKTRLAQHAMLALAPHFADGAAFVSLEDVAHTAEVGARLAGALGVPLAGRGDALDDVHRALAGRRMLLVLDNLEQLAVDAGWLDRLVRAAPQLKLLVTSRVRPLARLSWTLPVEGLPCPEPEDDDRLEAFDAARLFVRAAQRVEPALQPAAEAGAIGEICRLVAGLPLALELAAGFTRVLSCAAIAAELREGTELLRAADPSRPPRQASIEAVFEHSWRHLADAERSSLARLALFHGGFTAAAARQVADASLPVLAALADKSLLRKEGERCHLHPLLQQFALQRLDAGPDHDRTATAHAQHFLRQWADARRALAAGQRDALRDAGLEFDNLRAAWRWAAGHGEAPAFGSAALALMAFCDHRGRWREGLALLEEALAAAAAAADPGLAATLGAAAAHLEHRLDRYAEAETRAQRWLEPARRSGCADAEIQCTKVLAATALRLGRLAEARRWYQRTLKRAHEVGDAFTAAGTLDNLSLIERNRGRLDAALELSQQALAQHRALGDAAGEALCLNNQCVLLTLQNRLDAAREALLAARQLCERHGLTTTRAMVEVNLADLAHKMGDRDALQRHAEAALEISRACEQRTTEIVAHQLLVLAAIGRDDLPAARDQMRHAARLALAIRRPALHVNSVYVLAKLLAAQGDRDCAVQVMRFALGHPTIVGADREAALADIRSWGGSDPATPWHGPGLEALLNRIVLEAEVAFAPLMAELRVASPAA
ncbi:MAG: hypothetical protein HS128_17225 [Ideonella sp.]|nr:hypothetical protein [Ideonella sp.]MCC7458743.1 hypothetical protein [Nitrospira sp.]